MMRICVYVFVYILTVYVFISVDIRIIDAHTYVKFMAIRAAIRRQFEAIRDVFRQFGMFEMLGTRDSRQFGPRVLCLL